MVLSLRDDMRKSFDYDKKYTRFHHSLSPPLPGSVLTSLCPNLPGSILTSESSQKLRPGLGPIFPGSVLTDESIVGMNALPELCVCQR